MVKQERIQQDLNALWESRNKSQSNIKDKLARCFVHQSHTEVLKKSFAVAILTEWDEFKSYDWDAITKKMMLPAKVFDGRNILSKKHKDQIYSIGK